MQLLFHGLPSIEEAIAFSLQKQATGHMTGWPRMQLRCSIFTSISCEKDVLKKLGIPSWKIDWRSSCNQATSMRMFTSEL